MTKVVLSLSGGLDSTTLLAWLLDKKYDVTAFSFQYGSKHNSYETEAIAKIEKHYKLQVPIIDISPAFNQISSNLMMTGGEIPEGHYNDDRMSLTVIPGRNSIFITILAGIAESIGAKNVVIGVHGGDHHIYPDCRQEFISTISKAIQLSSGNKVSVWAPFLHWDKTIIVREGLALKVPYESTRTCYKHQIFACGKCGSCVERLEAFVNNGIQDPITYE